MSTQGDSLETPKATWQQVLADYPPYKTYMVDVRQGGGNWVKLPEVKLHCSVCAQVMTFEPREAFHPATDSNLLPLKWVQFACKQCEQELYGFALLVVLRSRERVTEWLVTKVGQYPAYGPQVPPKLVSLIGPEKDLFLKGRRCESQGLGIAAFAYYRRVIESQKDRLLDNVMKVIEKVKPDPERVARLVKAKEEDQFSKSMELAEDELPESLLLGDVNPLKLLHSVYSKGLHNDSDEECLALASTAREVLAALTERLAEVTKQHTTLKDAVQKLSAKGSAS